MNVLEVLAAFWASLVASLGGEALSLLFIVGFTAAFVALFLGLNAFRKTEFYKQHKEVLDLVDGRITDLIFLVEFGDVDLTEYEAKAAERELAGMEHIDPRMLYLLDKVEVWVKEKLHFEIDTDELLARAEHIFDEVVKSDTNNVGAAG